VRLLVEGVDGRVDLRIARLVGEPVAGGVDDDLVRTLSTATPTPE
jgi:hypothetical protein